MGYKLFSRRYCGTKLQWLVVQDEFDPQKAPDIVFQNDPTFSPLTAAEGADSSMHQHLVQMLKGWTSKSNLQHLLGLLLQLYAQHNKARISAAVTDDRILFELSMLEELGCTEVLLAGHDGSGPLQARFALPVPVDLEPAQQLLSCIHTLQQRTHPKQQPPAAVPGRITQHYHHHHHLQQQDQPQQAQDDSFVLTVSFPVSQGGSSSHIPALQLRSPSWFTGQLPPLTLPGWDAHTSLLEYVPHLAERITKHLTDHCPTATNRFLLFQALASLLGPPLEINMAPSPPTATAGSSSGGSAAAARSSGSAAAGLWQVLCDQQPLLLFVELPRSYPSEPPVLSLQNLRQGWSEGFMVLQNLPWSPRWAVDEQVARLFNFIKLQAAKAMVAEAAAGAGGVAAGGPHSRNTSPGPSPVAAHHTASLPSSQGYYL